MPKDNCNNVIRLTSEADFVFAILITCGIKENMVKVAADMPIRDQII